MRLILLGPPGAARARKHLHQEKFNIPQISTGDMLRSAREAGTPVGLRVREVMDRGELVSDAIVSALIGEHLDSASGKGAIFDGEGKLVGIVTDGDIARNLSRNLAELNVDDIMTRTPKTVRPQTLATAALGGQGGGGRPDMAQGGGPDGGAANDAVAAVKAALA